MIILAPCKGDKRQQGPEISQIPESASVCTQIQSCPDQWGSDSLWHMRSPKEPSFISPAKKMHLCCLTLYAKRFAASQWAGDQTQSPCQSTGHNKKSHLRASPLEQPHNGGKYLPFRKGHRVLAPLPLNGDVATKRT